MEYFGHNCGLIFDVINKSYHSLKIYRINQVVNVISGLIIIIVQVALWRALYSSGVHQDTELSDAITYSISYLFIIKKLFLYVSRDISDAVYSGEVETYLIKPVSMKHMVTLQNLGKNLFNFIYNSLPVILVAQIVYGISPPASGEALLYSGLTLLLGLVIFWYLELILGLSSFWLKANWYLPWVEYTLLGIFGGSLVPLWFFPGWLQSVCNFLPFKYLGYESIVIYLNGVDFRNFVRIVVFQLLWILIFWSMEKKLWKLAVSQLEVNGG